MTPSPQIAALLVLFIVPSQVGGTDDEQAQDPTLPVGEVPLKELSGEEREAAEALLQVRLEEQYFLTCDLDGNGWLSFRESTKSMQLAREQYFQFDADKDGRITRQEFGSRYQSTVEAIGAFRPPTSTKSLFSTHEGSPLQYDFNNSSALEQGELHYFLIEKGIQIPTNALFDMLDQDGSLSLELIEFDALIETLKPLLPAVEPDPANASIIPGELSDLVMPPMSIAELFGAREPREITYGSTPLPDRIPGPRDHFQRLDFDGDGLLREQDFLALLRPARVEVRPATIIAALDLDGDGALSRSEFLAALR